MEDNKIKQSDRLPLEKKLYLSITEAAEYSGIGINTIQNLVRKKDCPFVLMVGRKRMIQRKGFEEYLAEQNQI